MERRSRNTEENAEFSKAMVAPKAGERWLLVTSAYHMARAVGIFRKAGFAVEPYPVDWRMGGRDDVLKFSRSFLGGLGRIDTASREWMGLIAYWLTGKTSEFLPGPNQPEFSFAVNFGHCDAMPNAGRNRPSVAGRQYRPKRFSDHSAKCHCLHR